MLTSLRQHLSIFYLFFVMWGSIFVQKKHLTNLEECEICVIRMSKKLYLSSPYNNMSDFLEEVVNVEI